MGFLLHISLTIGILVICQALALILFFSHKTAQYCQRHHAGHSRPWFHCHWGWLPSLLWKMSGLTLFLYLFGDILAIGPTDLVWIYGGGGLALAGLLWLWKPLLAITIHEDLARVEGDPGRSG